MTTGLRPICKREIHEFSEEVSVSYDDSELGQFCNSPKCSKLLGKLMLFKYSPEYNIENGANQTATFLTGPFQKSLIFVAF